jgi:chromate transporter
MMAGTMSTRSAPPALPDTAADTLQARAAPRSCGELWRVFNRLTLQGFGGVLPVAQRELVERTRWLDKADFAEMLALGQVLPGPNIVNLALMIGDRYFGWRGALAALAGLLMLPLGIVLGLMLIYQHFADLPAVAGALRGMGVVAAGLVGATALKLMPTLRKNAMGWPVCALFTGLTVLGVGVLRWPLLGALFGLGLPAGWWAWRALGPAARPTEGKQGAGS